MSAPLTRDDVERVAALAQLELTPDEIALFTRQLAEVLSYAAELQTARHVGCARHRSRRHAARGTR
jgi:Asp-tRNA(Asn)/Glu-tRNA(Gln) amidotransferase C subunit